MVNRTEFCLVVVLVLCLHIIIIICVMCPFSLTMLDNLQTACKEIPHLEKEIAAGNFKPLRNWLKEKIHQVGSLHPNGDELMKAVTGSPLDPSVFLNYLRTKYTALYKL